MDAASSYKKLEHREHVLLRPGMYIGSVQTEPTSMYLVDGEIDIEGGTGARMSLSEVALCPGLAKIFDEIIVNAIDHATRTKILSAKTTAASSDANSSTTTAATTATTTTQVNRVRKIEITIDRETGILEVWNDGDGIPVVLSECPGTHEIWVPELIFGHMLSGSNFDDTEERTVGGQNGIGAKACNIFSRWFEIETLDVNSKVVYTQRFEDNMTVIGKPTIKKSTAKKPYTRVRFMPDYAKFGSTTLTDDMYRILVRRAYDVTAVTDPDVTIVLNSKKIDVKSFERYVDLYIGSKNDVNRVYERVADGWEVAVALTDGGGMQHVSFVNGIGTLRGGKHVEYVSQQIIKRTSDLLATKGKGKAKVTNIKPQFIRDSLFMFVKATVPNPTFDSQSKDTLTTPSSKFGVKIELSDKFIDKVTQLPGFIDRVMALSETAAQGKLTKTDGTKRATLYGLPKLDDAEWAGTAKSHMCTLILTEGDSAKASALAGLAVVGRQRWGVYPLRGKIMNVCDVSADRVAANAEISAIKKILGLQSGRQYKDASELRYGRLMVMTDADHDGSHIRGLLFNMFYQLFPSLLKIDGFMSALLTPVVKVKVKSSNKSSNNNKTKSNGKSNDEQLEFYNVKCFEEWSKTAAESKISFTSKYYKGLGTSTAEEARDWFRTMKVATYVFAGSTSSDALSLSFDKKRADDRKAWLQAYDPMKTLDYASSTVTLDAFVHEELIHFSQYDLTRSIPSVVDGLKVSQRKALFGCFKRGMRKGEEVRVAQLAAYVSEHSSFHHGETSMQGTIVSMAQAFVGSNNVPILHGVGQFGSRLMGGSDAASPRYIYAALPDITRLIFRREDDPVLEYLEDDGLSIEPKYYVPVIPMLLVNGAVGIGTGYSTNVPCHDPLDVISALRKSITEKTTDNNNTTEPEMTSALKPWYRGFTGSMLMHKGRLCSRGICTRVGTIKLRVTELPVGTWTEDFKREVEELIERAPEVKSYSNSSTDDRVDMTLTFASSSSLDAYLGPVSPDDTETRFEKEVKLISNKLLSTTNMHAFDSRGVISKYETAEDVITEFVDVRLKTYTKRKMFQTAELESVISVLSQKVRFLDLLLPGPEVDGKNKLDIRDKVQAELDAELESLGFTRVEGSYRFLTGMSISSMTRDKRAELAAELEHKRAALEILHKMTERDMWVRDLDELADQLKMINSC